MYYGYTMFICSYLFNFKRLTLKTMCKVGKVYIPEHYADWWREKNETRLCRIVRIGYVLATFNNFL